MFKSVCKGAERFPHKCKGAVKVSGDNIFAQVELRMPEEGFVFIFFSSGLGQKANIRNFVSCPKFYRIIVIYYNLTEMGTRVLGLGLESDSSPDLAGLGLESFISGLGLETCGLGTRTRTVGTRPDSANCTDKNRFQAT